MRSVARSFRGPLSASRVCFNTSSHTRFPSSLNTSLRTNLWRNFSSDGRDHVSRTARTTLKETVVDPTRGTPFVVGRVAVAGGAVVGLGALCFYGLGLADRPGAIDRLDLWPEFVKDRIKSTYTYLGSSVVLTAASTVACMRSPTIIRLMSKQSILAISVTTAVLLGTMVLARSIPYQPGFGSKQLAWMLHTGLTGALIAPLCLMAGLHAIRAVLYTAGVVGGLSAIAVCAPSDKFLYMTAPLGIGLGAVFVAAVGSLCLSPTSAAGAGLYSFVVYGGLLVFSGYLLYETQNIIREAEIHPIDSTVPFDPINASLSLYRGIINIFIRVLAIVIENSQEGGGAGGES